ncbi:MAG: exonuclease domain-containing protein, partial [Verrucomicrobiaceae bacterium]
DWWNVRVDATTGEILSEFCTFIHPVRHPLLSCFCKSLTTITQDEVNAAPAFREAVTAFANWLGQFESPVFCSWGDYDRNQLEQDCGFHDIPVPFSNGHRNLKKEFSKAIGSTKRFGLGQALDRLSLTFSGTPHRGIDDAKNIARVYKEILIHSGHKKA